MSPKVSLGTVVTRGAVAADRRGPPIWRWRSTNPVNGFAFTSCLAASAMGRPDTRSRRTGSRHRFVLRLLAEPSELFTPRSGAHPRPLRDHGQLLGAHRPLLCVEARSTYKTGRPAPSDRRAASWPCWSPRRPSSSRLAREHPRPPARGPSPTRLSTRVTPPGVEGHGPGAQNHSATRQLGTLASDVNSLSPDVIVSAGRHPYKAQP